MKLFLDIIYVLIENLIYVMYLDLFFKNREEVKYNKIFFIVFMSFLSLMMNKYFAISYGGIILLIISLIYIHLFYDGDIYNKIIKRYPIPKSSDEYITSVNLSKLNGGESFNQVPDYATMVLDIRYIEKDKNDIIEYIKNIDKNIEVKVLTIGSAFITDINNEYVKKYM